jgi:hypothetical protein
MVMPKNLKPGNLLAALADAEQAALEHVGHLRVQGVPLDEAAAAIGIDPANCKGWDDITQAYAGRHYDLAQRDLFGRGVP